MKVAVIGAGISGLSCAWKLERLFATHGDHGSSVTLFESNSYFGGHSNTVDVGFQTADGFVSHGVDTGFLVFNPQTYPQLVNLFRELDVPVATSDMSFAVSLPHIDLEWAGSNLDTVFAQRGNMVNPRFLRMLRDIMRFNRITTALAESHELEQLPLSLGEFLEHHRFSAEFRDWYFLPMAGCIWSCPTAQMRDFPVRTMIRFCHNHGLLQVSDRPQWSTVRGGSREYVRRMLAQISDARLDPVLAVRRPVDHPSAGVQVHSASGVEIFDEVIFACHSDQTLALLQDSSEHERRVLGSVQYQQNRAVLHTDSSLLPARKKVWSAWNYTSLPATSRAGEGESPAQVCVHYLINRLQPLPAAWGEKTVIVSLNPVREPAPEQVLRE
ncbi:MAG: FAD-dependent oxidoreductase, partial [Lacisediminimonas sp.]|nr:FAD-dependent oxidoreductase [Lacisediminimonas sp.]